jgi:hypothetical protein
MWPLIALALISAGDNGAKTPYVVLPVHAVDPPSMDPTLLRLTRKIADGIEAAVKEEVRVASRELRDDRCPSQDGDCPPRVADDLDAERVVSMALAKDFKSVVVRVYRGGAIETQGKLPCKWDEGSVDCDVEKIGPIISKREHEQPATAVDRKGVERAFEATKKLFARCPKLETPLQPGQEVTASVRLRPDGKVTDVRIDPRELYDAPRYTCIAEILESMRAPSFDGTKPEPFRFTIEGVPAKKPAARKSKTKK